MKVLMITSLLLSSTAFAQKIDLKTAKSLFSERKATLENVYQGMSKKLFSITRFPTEIGPCEMSLTAIQTVLKIEDANIIVHSLEKYAPAATPACAGFETQEAVVLFYEAKPSLSNDLAELDASAADIQEITKDKDVLTLSISANLEDETGKITKEIATVKYDLSKPSFKNLIFMKDSGQTTTGEDSADVDVNSIDLKKVFFCESSDSDNCSEGDYSDILF